MVAEAATGLKVGDVFVHRNVGNVLSHSDSNAMSALEYSVKVRAKASAASCQGTHCTLRITPCTLRTESAHIKATRCTGPGEPDRERVYRDFERLLASFCQLVCEQPRCGPQLTRPPCLQVLGVKHVLVCGHTNCGAVKAALTLPSSSALLTNCWISQIRDIRNQHVDELVSLPLDKQVAHLVRFNVMKQVFNVCTSPVVQQMWEDGKEVFVHGLQYDVSSGTLSRLVGPVSGNDEVPEDLGSATSFDGAALDGHTLDDALKKLADALAAAPSDTAEQLKGLNLQGGRDATANVRIGARETSSESGGAQGKSKDGDSSAALSALLGLAQRASVGQGGGADASLDSRVLHKMQSHLAFEEAAKQPQ